MRNVYQRGKRFYTWLVHVRTSTCSGGIGEDPLDMASKTGRSCGTVGMDTGMEALE